jgi:hypothetical protein
MVNLAELDAIRQEVLMVFKLLLDILQYKRHGYKKEVNINKF